jgi:WD40 repeat protein
MGMTGAGMANQSRRVGRGRITNLVWSPDGTALLVASSVGLWRYAAYDLAAEPRLVFEHAHPLLEIAVSPDASLLAAGTEYGTVRVWTAAGEARHVFEGFLGPVNAVAFSPDGKFIAAGGQDGSVRVWEMERGHRRLLLSTRRGEEYYNEVHSVAWSPDGMALAAGGYDGLVRVWDSATGAPLRAMKGRGVWITGVAYSPDGATLAAACVDGSTWIWDAATGEDLFIMEGHTGTTDAVHYCPVSGPGGYLVASGGGDGEVVLWDAANGEFVHSLGGHTGGVIGVAFSPDGKHLAVASWDQRVRVWRFDPANPAGATLCQVIEGHMDTVWGGAWSLDGQQVIAASDEAMVRVWDVATGRLVRSLERGPDWVQSIARSPAGAAGH